jgi:pimeloyl-ACP methyl ester carboxylesterase
MIPLPGETVGAWWENTGSTEARVEAARHGGYAAEFDDATYFLHDVPPEIIEAGKAHERSQTEAVFEEVCRFESWHDVPMHVIAGRDDRFFPVAFQRRVARERLGLPVDELPGGHIIALSNPRGLVDRLLRSLHEPSFSGKSSAAAGGSRRR